MAQAARLSLRMQKELKLLLSDPPPGASFPLLSSSSSSSSSLSSIDAQIKGPEGTVYAEGFFKIKIQIPERYPFQPPIVTFATPIYHPNIDNGGRICLDILNLPPKGAWQPSLNISTVLTSIGLLLSEPNPDDGLMCEVSREYKYNRQAFDQKARSMTQKYAKAGENGNDSCSQSIHSSSNPSAMEAKGPDESQSEVNQYFISQKKLCGISRKLSLESSVSNLKGDSDKGENEVPIPHLIDRIEVEGLKEESKKMFDEYYQSCEKLKGTRRKLSLESFSPSQMKGGDNKENLVPDQHSFFLKTESVSAVSSGSLPLLQVSNHHEQQSSQDRDGEPINDSTNTSAKKLCCVGQIMPIESVHSPQISADNDEKLHTMPQLLSSQTHSSVSHGCLPMPLASDHNEVQLQKVPVSRTGNGFPNIKRKKLGLAGKKLPLGSLQRQEKDNKENVAPIQKLPISQPNSLSTASSMSSLMSQMGGCVEGEAGSCVKNMAHRRHGIGCKLPLEPLCQLQGSSSGDTLMNTHTENPTKTPSKSLPMLYDFRHDGKQPSKEDHGEEKAGAIIQGGEGSPKSETVIVLDSEDSEEENNGSLKPKLLLARKRLAGKWKVKT